jgi:hypothetical protein
MPAILVDLLLFLAVEGFDAPRWSCRERASRWVERCGALAVPHLERGLAHPSLEVRRRCELLLRPHAARLALRDADALLAAHGSTPWVCDGSSPWSGWLLTHTMSALVRVESEHLPRGAPDWAEYRRATRRWVAGQLIAREPPAAILAAVQGMAEAEAEWHRSRP